MAESSMAVVWFSAPFVVSTLWYAFRFAGCNPRQLPKNAVACRLVDFGFDDLDTNAAGEPPCTRWPRAS